VDDHSLEHGLQEQGQHDFVTERGGTFQVMGMNRSMPSALLVSSVFAGTLAACGGIAEPAGAGGTGKADVPAASGSGDSSMTETSKPDLTKTEAGAPTNPVPRSTATKPAIKPYAGAVATTDVSILYPMPGAGASLDFIRPEEVSPHGILFSSALYAKATGSQPLNGHPPIGYTDLRLVGLRLDPCAPHGDQGCAAEARAVFQNIDPTSVDRNGVANNEPGARDGALHVVYRIPAGELVEMAQEILTLKEANGDLASSTLGPHPILALQGLGGPFAVGVRNIVLWHMGEARIARVTHFDHHGLEGEAWTFRAFDRVGDVLVPSKIPHNDTSLTVNGSGTNAPLESSIAHAHSNGGPIGGPDNVLKLVGYRGGLSQSELRSAFDSALRLENPTVHNVETTDCVNCHLADGAKRLGSALYGFTGGETFVSFRSLARVDQRTSVTNLHAFGYLGRDVAVMQRTANESALVADQISAAIVPK
jgi:hypothetical protein